MANASTVVSACCSVWCCLQLSRALGSRSFAKPRHCCFKVLRLGCLCIFWATCRGLARPRKSCCLRARHVGVHAPVSLHTKNGGGYPARDGGGSPIEREKNRKNTYVNVHKTEQSETDDDYEPPNCLQTHISLSAPKRKQPRELIHSSGSTRSEEIANDREEQNRYRMKFDVNYVSSVGVRGYAETAKP